MSGNWDDEEYEVEPPAEKPAAPAVNDKWAGEDEDRVKDNWDDDDEVSKPASVSAAAPKKKKKQIIAEKQAIKEAELKAKRLEMERINAEMSPEEKVTEKVRLQKIQEESDLQFAVDMMGLKEADTVPLVSSITDADLSTAAGLEALGTAVIKKIRDTDKLEMKNFYIPFVENFCKELCINMEPDELKKVTATLNAFHNEKVKAGKPTKGKKKAGKAKLHMGKEVDEIDNDRYIDDFDDFI